MKTYNEFMEQYSGRTIGDTNSLASKTISARKDNERAAEQRRREAEQNRAEREREAEQRKAEAERARKENLPEAVVKKSPYASKAVGRLVRKSKLSTPKSVASSVSDAGKRAKYRALAPLGSAKIHTRNLMAPLKPKPFNPIKSAAQATQSALKSKAKKAIKTVDSAIKDKIGI